MNRESGIVIDVNERARSPISPSAIQRLAREVLRAEKRKRAIVSISLVGPTAMRRLNRQYLGESRLTDVIAFAFPIPDSRFPIPEAGDIYICPAVARKNAREAGVSEREELRRLVIHGLLHVLGYDHPSGDSRTRSPMWRRQERYLARLST